MLGAEGVGKSSLCAQFLSSEHINAYDRVGKQIVIYTFFPSFFPAQLHPSF